MHTLNLFLIINLFGDSQGRTALIFWVKNVTYFEVVGIYFQNLIFLNFLLRNQIACFQVLMCFSIDSCLLGFGDCFMNFEDFLFFSR